MKGIEEVTVNLDEIRKVQRQAHDRIQAIRRGEIADHKYQHMEIAGRLLERFNLKKDWIDCRCMEATK